MFNLHFKIIYKSSNCLFNSAIARLSRQFFGFKWSLVWVEKSFTKINFCEKLFIELKKEKPKKEIAVDTTKKEKRTIWKTIDKIINEGLAIGFAFVFVLTVVFIVEFFVLGALSLFEIIRYLFFGVAMYSIFSKMTIAYYLACIASLVAVLCIVFYCYVDIAEYCNTRFSKFILKIKKFVFERIYSEERILDTRLAEKIYTKKELIEKGWW